MDFRGNKLGQEVQKWWLMSLAEFRAEPEFATTPSG
jgi:hypothetical protein